MARPRVTSRTSVARIPLRSRERAPSPTRATTESLQPMIQSSVDFLPGSSCLWSLQEWEAMAGSANEEKTFKRFLELFLREMKPPLQEDVPLPMRPLTDLISEYEVEGECLDLCLQHLCK